MGIILWFLRLTLLPLTLADPLLFFMSRLAKQVSTQTLRWTDTIPLWPSVFDNIGTLHHLIQVNAWRTLSHSLPLPPPAHLPLAFSDASLTGGAGVVDGRVVWTCKWPQTPHNHNILELETRAWKTTVKWMSDHHFTAFVTITDSQPLYYSLIKTRSKNFQVNSILRDVILMLREKKTLLYVGWIDTKAMPADAASRGVNGVVLMPNVNQILFSQYPIVFSCDE